MYTPTIKSLLGESVLQNSKEDILEEISHDLDYLKHFFNKQHRARYYWDNKKFTDLVIKRTESNIIKLQIDELASSEVIAGFQQTIAIRKATWYGLLHLLTGEYGNKFTQEDKENAEEAEHQARMRKDAESMFSTGTCVACSGTGCVLCTGATE